MLAACLLLTGCGQTPTPVPGNTAADSVTESASVELPGVSIEQMEKDLAKLASQTRPIGSQGEQMAAQYIQERLQGMGYAVTTQSYTDDRGNVGTNVIASTEDLGGDVLVFATHHDTDPSAWGANDNASGVSVLLAVAESLKDLPTDTQLRFISFTDEEGGKQGSRAYVESLPEEELQRMVGCVQLDMLGGLGSQGSHICTMDGTANYLSELLSKHLDAPLEMEAASDHASFQLAGVPSVLLTQKGRGYLYHSAGDTPENIRLEDLAEAAAAAAALGWEIISPDTPSYLSLAQSQAQGYTYRQTPQTMIYFDTSLADTQSYLGSKGELTEEWEEGTESWTDSFSSYRYSMTWFGGEKPMNTYYIFRNGFLDHIEIRPEETGYTVSDVNSLIENQYGSAEHVSQSEETSTQSWADEIYSKYITLSTEDGCTVTISSYSVGITNILASYPVAEGEVEIADPTHAQVWEVLCGILPKEARQKIGQFNLFTDGYSNVLAYTAPVQRGDGTSDNSSFVMNLDYYDVYDENGQPRDWGKLTYTILHEYGHVLLESDSQLDLSLGNSTHDPATFLPGSLRKEFFDTYWAGLGDSAVSDYYVNPTNYVSRYGANYFHEDIADTFAVFVLADKPQGRTVAEEKMLTFWEDEEMVTLRQQNRDQMGLK